MKSRKNWVVTRDENDELLAVNMDQIKAFWQHDEEHVFIAFTAPEKAGAPLTGFVVRDTFMHIYNVMRSLSDLPDVTREQLESAVKRGDAQ